jgi:tRNA-binding protein
MKEIKPASIKPTISFSDLNKIDIRIGTILSVDDVDNSEKLVKLKVDFGDHQRQILVGMKQEREDPKEVEGKQALFVLNLEPRKMVGELSEGMIFDIGYSDKIVPVLAIPEKQVPNGVRAG